MSAIMTSAIARTAARSVPRLTQQSAFSTARVLRNAEDSTARRGGVAGIFPRRIGWGGALVLFSLGVADGMASTSYYFLKVRKE